LKIRAEGTVEDIIFETLGVDQPLGHRELAAQCGLGCDEMMAAVDRLVKDGRVVVVGQGKQSLLFTSSGWDQLAKKAKEAVEKYHKKFATRPGIPKGELSSTLKLLPTSPAFKKLFDAGILIEDSAAVHLPSHRIQLSSDQQEKIDDFLSALKANPYSPPADITLEADLMNLLLEQRRVVKVNDGVVFSSDAYDQMVNKVVTYIRANGKVTLAEVRDMLGTSRKYAQALLEYMDEKKITRRVGDERILR